MIKKVVVDLPEPYVSLYDRTEDMEYYKKYPDGRRDIALVLFRGVCNTFVYTYGVDVQPWEGVVIEKCDWDRIKKIAYEAFLSQAPKDYIQKHKEFFASLDK
jgi:hypothetical protein